MIRQIATTLTRSFKGTDTCCTVPSSSSSSGCMKVFQACKVTKTEEYECLLTKTTTTKHERAVKIGKGKKRPKEHVLAHHTGLDLISFEGTLSNPGVALRSRYID